MNVSTEELKISGAPNLPLASTFKSAFLDANTERSLELIDSFKKKVDAVTNKY